MRMSVTFVGSGMSAATNERVYLDTNVFIYALEGPADVKAAIQPFLLKLGAARGLGVTSELTLAEVLVKPERMKLRVLKWTYIDLLSWSGAVALQPVTRRILMDSAKYRAVAHPDIPAPSEDRRNFLPDSTHVVRAIQSKCTIFLGRDTRIRLPAGMRRVTPDPAGMTELMGMLP